MEKYGFVYIWYDRKHKRYYIGSHWGFEGDGYICSSTWMRNSYKRRPADFRGPRILTKIYTNRKELYEEEHRWLSLIKDEELGKKYYNLVNHEVLKKRARSEKYKKIRSKAMKELANKGKHPFQRADSKKLCAAQRKRVENGTHHFILNRKEYLKKRKENGTCSLLRTEIQRENGKRSAIKQYKEGKHNFNKLLICKYCGKSANLGNYKQYHGDKCKEHKGQ